MDNWGAEIQESEPSFAKKGLNSRAQCQGIEQAPKHMQSLLFCTLTLLFHLLHLSLQGALPVRLHPLFLIYYLN